MATIKPLLSNRRAAALIEFAIVAPMLVALLFGIIGYAQYFLLAHSAQQLANDAARSAIAGVTEAERTAIAEAAVDDGRHEIGFVAAEHLTRQVDERDGRLTVQVVLDTTDIVLRLPIVPMPDPTIVRAATTRLNDAT